MKRRFGIIDAPRVGVLFVAMIATATVGCEQRPASETKSGALVTKVAPRGHGPAPAPSHPADEVDGAVGVAACDEWAEKYLVCIDGKAPEAARAHMKVAIGQTRGTWRKTAQTAEGRAALAPACTRMIESSRQATAPLGCEW